jgi:hypothetical protein
MPIERAKPVVVTAGLTASLQLPYSTQLERPFETDGWSIMIIGQPSKE